MNPLAIALQGIGFGAAMVAMQGFAVSIIEQPAFYGADDDSGARLIRQNNLFILVASAFIAQKEFE